MTCDCFYLQLKILDDLSVGNGKYSIWKMIGRRPTGNTSFTIYQNRNRKNCEKIINRIWIEMMKCASKLFTNPSQFRHLISMIHYAINNCQNHLICSTHRFIVWIIGELYNKFVIRSFSFILSVFAENRNVKLSMFRLLVLFLRSLELRTFLLLCLSRHLFHFFFCSLIQSIASFYVTFLIFWKIRQNKKNKIVYRFASEHFCVGVFSSSRKFLSRRRQSQLNE